MSGESIYGLYAKNAAAEKQLTKNETPYTGKYEKHMEEPPKPVYSTFFEKHKEYDGSNVRFFKQRDAVIGKNVGDDVDPHNFLKRGEGIRHVVPPVHKEKVYCKPPLEHNRNGPSDGNGPAGSANGGAGGEFDENGNPLPDGNRFRGGGGDGEEAEYDAQGNLVSSNAHGYNADGRGDPRDASKNFIASNIVEVSNMVPKRRKEQAPLATDRKSFGKAPAYLSRVKGEIAQEEEFVRVLEDAKAQRQEQAYARYVYLLPHDEHRELVASLEKRRDECVSELQKMPYAKDTVTMKKRKTDLERTITDIEAALKKLDKEALFVYKDDPVNGQWAKEAALKEAQRYAAGSA